jgi:hypothetical protein
MKNTTKILRFRELLRDFNILDLFKDVTPNEKANTAIAHYFEEGLHDIDKSYIKNDSIEYLKNLVKELSDLELHQIIEKAAQFDETLGAIAYYQVYDYLLEIEKCTDEEESDYRIIPTDMLLGILTGRSHFLPKKDSYIINATQRVSYGGEKMLNIPVWCSKYLEYQVLGSYTGDYVGALSSEEFISGVESIIGVELTNSIKPKEWNFAVAFERVEWTGTGSDKNYDYGLVFTNKFEDAMNIKQQLDSRTSCVIVNLKPKK